MWCHGLIEIIDMIKLTEYYKGWIEALIDGEGSISLLREKRKQFRAGVTYKPRLNISNKNLKLLEQAKDIIGHGAIHPNGKSGVYNLDISAEGMRYILPKITLIVKEEQRLLLIEALKILNIHIQRGRGRTDAEIESLGVIRTNIMALNGRGWWRK